MAEAMPVEHVILTHGDLDGMVCGILLLKSLPADAATIRITNGVHLPRELRQLAELDPLPSQVVITDIPLLSGRTQSLVEALRDLHARDVKLLIYDHHTGWDQAPEVSSLCSVYCVDTRKTTAAALVWRERLRGDRTSQQWLRLLSERARSDDPVIRERFGLLAALMQPQHYSQTEAVLRALAGGGDLLAEHRRLSEWHYTVHVPREHRLAENALVLPTASGRRLGWLDLRAEEGFLLVAPLVMQAHPVDTVVTVTQRAVLVGGSSIDRGLDLSFLHGEYEVNGVAVRVGGHKSPVSLTPVGTRNVTDEFVEAARRLLFDLL